MNNPDHISRELINRFLGLKYFDADPGWKRFGSGINISDPQHCQQYYIMKCLCLTLRYIYFLSIVDVLTHYGVKKAAAKVRT